MIHHVSVGSNDVARAGVFYDAVLPEVGLTLFKAIETALDYGSGYLHFSVETPADGQRATVGNGSHVAFSAEDRATLDRFHAAALANGGSSDGAPGIRSDYDDQYYGEFVRDPDGNKVEAMTFSGKWRGGRVLATPG